jgi:hypothetical protein
MNKVGPDPELAQMLIGAGSSVDIIVQSGEDLEGLHPLEHVTVLLDKRIKARAILCTPGFNKGDGIRQVVNLHFRMTAFPPNWEVRVSPITPSASAIVVDAQEALILEYAGLGDLRTSPYERTSDPDDVAALQDHFNRLWSGGSQVDLLQEDLIRLRLPSQRERVISVSTEFWDRMIHRLRRNPKELYSLNPRRFEELIAELLSRNGLDVHLTPTSKDGGFDIMACLSTPMGRLLYLVECKRWARERPIGVQIVNALYGVVESKKATAGMIVTTSTFTRGALGAQKATEHRLTLKEYEDIVDWLRS